MHSAIKMTARSPLCSRLLGLSSHLLPSAVLLLSANLTMALTRHVPADYPTIAAALFAASAGDTVLVACGDYKECDLDLKTGVVLRSELGVAGCVTINGGGKGRILNCLDLDLPTRIEGFTLTGGIENDGGALWCANSELSVTNCIFSENTSTTIGGGFSTSYCGPSFTACLILNNEALSGGGGYCNDGNPTFTACAFVGNRAEAGGGLHCDTNTFAKVEGCVFNENTAQVHGGGVACTLTSSGVFKDCYFLNNQAGVIGFGAGMSIYESSPHLISCQFIGNAAGTGSAVYCVYSAARFSFCSFTQNSAISGGTALTYHYSDPLLRNCTFVENAGSAGTVIYPGIASVGRFERCVIAFGSREAFECYPRTYPSLQQCNIFGNEGGDWTGCIADQADSNGNLCLDPLFCELASGDLQLCADSVCLPANNAIGLLIGATAEGCENCGAHFTSVELVDGDIPSAGQGACMIDYDRDGDLDLYVVNLAQPNRLWENLGYGVFQNAATGLLAEAGASRSATWADFDNDGYLDVYISRDGQPNSLLRNEGDGSFTNVTGSGLGDPGPGRGTCWADFDLDGLLDLYLVNQDEANILFKSFGDMGTGWIFLPQTGVMSDPGPGSCAAWCDYDLDGDPDLYLANENEPNLLLHNEYPLGFIDMASGGSLADYGNGQGVAWGDYDNNGYFDLYLANNGQADRLFAGFASGLTLTSGEGHNDGGNGRGIAWGDFDNDGDLDLYLARHDQQDILLDNQGNGEFGVLPVITAALSGATNAVVAGDVDGDGDLDLFVVQENEPDYLLLNDLDSANHWLQVKLTGTVSNSMAVGAHLRIVAGGSTQKRQIACGSGHFSQNPPWVHFGLGSAVMVDSLVIRWPSGIVQVLTDLAPDRSLRVVEAEGTTPVASSREQPLAYKLHPAFPNPCNPATNIAYDLPRATRVQLGIYDLFGRLVCELVPDVMQNAGHHAVRWDGRDAAGRLVSAGVYAYRLRAGSLQLLRQLVLVK